MAGSKKLQVFVSSTFTDLREERQAAVEAILSSGHIPAGMELFTAGDESQMSVIRRWIDESDVYLLILGGRYGSLEPTTGKSYTHLEYEYALSKGKPLFAVVIDDAALEKRIRKGGRKNVEIENAKPLKEFREIVLSRMVRFWSDHRDIKLAIHETMSEFGRRADLTGWIPGDQVVNAGLLAEEVARLTKENTELRNRITHSPDAVVRYNGLTFDEYVRLLTNEFVDLSAYLESERSWAREAAAELGDSANLLDLCWASREVILGGTAVHWRAPEFRALSRLAAFGVLNERAEDDYSTSSAFEPTADGRRFVLRLMADRAAEA